MNEVTVVPSGAIRTIPGGVNCLCREGAFWITWKNSRDYLLLPENQLSIPSWARTVRIQAIGDKEGRLEVHSSGKRDKKQAKNHRKGHLSKTRLSACVQMAFPDHIWCIYTMP